MRSLPNASERGMVNSMPSKVHNLQPSTFELIDTCVFEWLRDTLNIHATTNEGRKPVKTIWLTAERAFQVKDDKDMRTLASDALVFPMMSIERTGVTKTSANERPFPAHTFPTDDYRKGSFTISRRLKQDKTRNFARSTVSRFSARQVNGRLKDNKKIVYQTLTVPLPVYYDMTYDINIRTDYQQQMNEIMSVFMTHTGHINVFKLQKLGHIYEAFIDDNYSINNNLSALGEEEKQYETTVSLKVVGYLMGAEDNEDGPKVTLRENPVEIRFQRERIIVGDIEEAADKDQGLIG